ncbi:hypothetical protein [Mesobacillus zeae]
MKPDKDEEEKIRSQAKEYISRKFADVVVNDALYNSMGNFDHFDYAVKVENK